MINKLLKNKLKIQILSSILILFSFFIIVIFGDQGIKDIFVLYKQKQQLINENSKIEQQNQLLFRIVDRLKHDPKYIENIARKELGMIGKNELIFKFKN